MKKTLLLASIILFSVVSLSYALETDTHEVINEYIVRNILNGFSLNSYLKEELNIEEGIEQLLEKKEIVEWLKEGGKYEDVPPDSAPFIRSVNHFHNPISNKGFSGFFGTGLFSGESALQWSQKPPETQCPGGYYSWHDVRGYFLKALTSPAKTERDENFARTFRGLGQIMHLVQDMSVLAHTRDDGHLFYNYETWEKGKDANGKPNLDITNITPIFYTPFSIGGPNPLAGVPFANLFDTNQYDGSNPDITLRDDIGLSEFTNVNFFSNDTIFKKFPYPDWSSVSEEIEVSELPDPRDPTVKANRKYFIKDKHGATGYRLSTVPYLVKYFDENFNELELKLPPVLDDFVYGDYAEKLIPRAVGFSTGLINYFFRGEIDVKKVEEGFEITNTSKEIMKDGHFELYYDKKDAKEETGLIRKNIAIISGTEVPEDNPINPGGSQTIMFTEPDDAKSYMVVYRGGLGNETNSVVGKVKPVNAFYLTLARSDGLVLKDEPEHGVEIQVYNSKKEKLDVEVAYNREKKRWEVDLGQNENPDGFYLAYNCAEGIRTEYPGEMNPPKWFYGDKRGPNADPKEAPPYFKGSLVSPGTYYCVIQHWAFVFNATHPASDRDDQLELGTFIITDSAKNIIPLSYSKENRLKYKPNENKNEYIYDQPFKDRKMELVICKDFLEDEEIRTKEEDIYDLKGFWVFYIQKYEDYEGSPIYGIGQEISGWAKYSYIVDDNKLPQIETVEPSGALYTSYRLGEGVWAQCRVDNVEKGITQLSGIYYNLKKENNVASYTKHSTYSSFKNHSSNFKDLNGNQADGFLEKDLIHPWAEEREQPLALCRNKNGNFFIAEGNSSQVYEPENDIYNIEYFYWKESRPIETDWLLADHEDINDTRIRITSPWPYWFESPVGFPIAEKADIGVYRYFPTIKYPPTPGKWVTEYFSSNPPIAPYSVEYFDSYYLRRQSSFALSIAGYPYERTVHDYIKSTYGGKTGNVAGAKTFKGILGKSVRYFEGNIELKIHNATGSGSNFNALAPMRAFREGDYLIDVKRSVWIMEDTEFGLGWYNKTNCHPSAGYPIPPQHIKQPYYIKLTPAGLEDSFVKGSDILGGPATASFLLPQWDSVNNRWYQHLSYQEWVEKYGLHSFDKCRGFTGYELYDHQVYYAVSGRNEGAFPAETSSSFLQKFLDIIDRMELEPKDIQKMTIEYNLVNGSSVPFSHQDKITPGNPKEGLGFSVTRSYEVIEDLVDILGKYAMLEEYGTKKDSLHGGTSNYVPPEPEECGQEWYGPPYDNGDFYSREYYIMIKAMALIVNPNPWIDIGRNYDEN